MLPPILMTPAWRHGDMTPWGGEELHRLYGKASPGPRAGESLELSAIPGLESTDTDGNTLGALIKRHGSRLLGSAVATPFPLLLKLIDAHEQLSVQVHPDDSYAREKHAKFGKNEAWVILHCQPGAKLIVGLKEGVSLDDLRAASLRGSAVEALMRTVDVRPGDTFYIPAGTVHAIGAGLVLYEIQQSSDVTYRLYDWGRLNSEGKGRELHLEDSLAVTQTASRPEAAQPIPLERAPEGLRERLLDTPFFLLDRLKDCENLNLSPDSRRFQVLTALSSARLHWEGGSLPLQAGQTALIPADAPPLRFQGQYALLAAPAIKP